MSVERGDGRELINALLSSLLIPSLYSIHIPLLLFTALLLTSSLLWSGAIISQQVSIALIAAVSSLVNTIIALRIRDTAHENTRKIEEVGQRQRIVITRTDKGMLITDEEVRELEPRPSSGQEWEWPRSH